MTAQQVNVRVGNPASVRSLHPVLETSDGTRVEVGFPTPSGETWGLTIGVFGDDETIDPEEASPVRVFARLDRAQVRWLRDELSAWLDRTGF